MAATAPDQSRSKMSADETTTTGDREKMIFSHGLLPIDRQDCRGDRIRFRKDLVVPSKQRVSGCYTASPEKVELEDLTFFVRVIHVRG